MTGINIIDHNYTITNDNITLTNIISYTQFCTNAQNNWKSNFYFIHAWK